MIINITENNKNLLLGILHLGQFEKKERCSCSNPLYLLVPHGKFENHIEINDLVEKALGEKQYVVFMKSVYKVCSATGQNFTTSGCVPVNVLFDVITRMLSDGDIVVVD